MQLKLHYQKLVGVTTQTTTRTHTIMLKDTLKHLTSQGLQAVQAGSKIGAAAAADIEQQSTAPELKDFLRRGNAQAKIWTDRVAQAVPER